MINKIKKGYKKYIELNYNARSSIPVNVVHDGLGELLNSLIEENDNFSIRTSNSGGEYKFLSAIHEKKIDITLMDNDINKPIVAISCKMPLSSVNKNLKNYFEMNIGDTTLVRESGIPFFFFMILDKYPIKWSNSRLKIENISNTSISSFQKVISSNVYSNFRPNYSFIAKINFGDLNYKEDSNGVEKKYFTENINTHLEIVDNFNATGEVYLSDGTWDHNFQENLRYFKETIKLEIELYKIRKKT